LLGLVAFLIIAYVGTQDRRVAGVLATFPILNGMAMVTDWNPFGVANAIYPIVMFNAVLFCFAISYCKRLPPLPDDWSKNTILGCRLGFWIVLWFAGAFVLTYFDKYRPSVEVLLVSQLSIATGYIAARWTRDPVEAKPILSQPLAYHRVEFKEFWISDDARKRFDALMRVLAFITVFGILLVVASRYESKWVGMASALPLPGLFAVATLTVMRDPKTLFPIRDTIFLGPILVIVFNWSLARVVSHNVVTDIPTLLLFWAVAALVVFWAVPIFAACVDRWHSDERRGRNAP
jgi:hypothetical protein